MDAGLVKALHSRCIDFASATDAGMRNQGDNDQLRVSSSQGRVLYSFNTSDYQRLHYEWLASGRSHAGMTLCQQ
jgi:hypothetical protein